MSVAILHDAGVIDQNIARPKIALGLVGAFGDFLSYTNIAFHYLHIVVSTGLGLNHSFGLFQALKIEIN